MLVLVDRKNDAHKSPEYLALNPNGTIPCSSTAMSCLYEAAAICLHYSRTSIPRLRWCRRLARRTCALLQVARLVHEHAAGDAHALLLSRAAWSTTATRPRLRKVKHAAPKRASVPCSTSSTRSLRCTAGEWLLPTWLQRGRIPSRSCYADGRAVSHDRRASLPHLAPVPCAMLSRPAVQRVFATEKLPPPFV
jgi:glutathione S-transferase